MEKNIDYKKIITEVVTACLIIIISGIAIYSFIVISEQDVDMYKESSKVDLVKGNNRIQEVLSIIEEKSMKDVDVNELVDGAIQGMLATIDDPYARYLTEDEYIAETTEEDDKYTGIGVHLAMSSKTSEMTIISVMAGSPAKEAGVLSGDVITNVEGEIVTVDNYHQMVDRLKGEEGTIVNFTVKRNGEEIQKNVVRKSITANYIESSVLEGNIGYIRILEFEKGVYDKFKIEYEDLVNNKKVIGLIIDVRDNPGGIVTETVQIADLLCGEGKILEIDYRDGTKRVYTSDKNKINVSLVMLVNENSASASEILAGAVKDLRQGVLVGETTFGKGIIQSVIKLESAGAISITTAKYYTAGGLEIHGNGIAPNVEIELPEESRGTLVVNQTQDSQLQEGIRIIKNNGGI